MATGSSEVATDEGATKDLSDHLTGEDPLSVVATPSARHVLTAAVLASAAESSHLRIVGPDRPPLATTATVTTAPGLADAEIECSPYTPLSDVLEIVEMTELPRTLREAIQAVRAVGTDPMPGIVATHPEIEASLEHSIRLPTVETPSTTGVVSELDADQARALGAWLAATAVSNDPSRASAQSLRSGLGPTAVDTGPIPTAEGVVDIIETATETAPGVTLAALLGDGGWTRIIDTYETAHDATESTVDSFPAGADEGIVVADVEGAPVQSAARYWAANGLAGEYGIVMAGDEPAVIGLVAAGDRSASAVLETVTGRRGGTTWGGPFVATAVLETRPADPTATIEGAL